MHCIDSSRDAVTFGFASAKWRVAMSTAAILVASLAGCGGQPTQAPAPAPATNTAKAPAAAPAPAPAPAPVAKAPEPQPAPPSTATTAAGKPVRFVKLGPPATPRNATELRTQMATRLVAAHPDSTFSTRTPDRLLAIPVIEVELNADGSVRNIDVIRKPSTGNEATQLAIDAIRRAAPYGDVSRLPKPWKVTETFLFDDDLRFKPRSLDKR